MTTHTLNTARTWAPLEMSTAPGSDRAELREAHLRAIQQRELGWTDAEINAYWAGFLGAIEWYTSRMLGRKL
jgi:hypothetical protein